MQSPEIYVNNQFGSQFYTKIVFPNTTSVLQLLEWRDGETILDYGCGPGEFGYKVLGPTLQKYNLTRLYSVDVSEEAVKFARKNYSHPRINYHLGDILQPGFPLEMKFDKIFCFLVFHYIQDLQVLLEGLQKILKPGGKLVFTSVTQKFWAFEMIKILSKSEEWAEYMSGSVLPDWSDYLLEECLTRLRTLLKDTGYRVVHLEGKELKFTIEDVESCLDFHISALPAFRNVPKDLHTKLKGDMRKIITGLAGKQETAEVLELPLEFIAGVVKNPTWNDNDIM